MGDGEEAAHKYRKRGEVVGFLWTAELAQVFTLAIGERLHAKRTDFPALPRETEQARPSRKRP